MKKAAILLFCFSSMLAHAQQALFNNKGALIHANSQVIIKVKGSFLNDTGSTFTNHGNTTIDTNYINNALSEGDGIYRVGVNWVNNETFVCDTSQVILYGANQLITGDSVSHFYFLELTGTGIKRQTLDAYTNRILILNDRELATDSFNMTVTNPNVNAITRFTGFVSSLAQGRLIRATNTVAPYLFPTGSSLGIQRYRPVTISPVSVTACWYGVRLANNDANFQGYNRSQVDSFVCDLNPLFYHFINRNGTIDADVAVFYDPAQDGSWDGLAYWNPLTPNRWNDMSPVTSGNVPPNLNYNRKMGWTNWLPEAYILDKVRPPVPLIVGDTLVCGGDIYNYAVEPPNSLYTYSWNVTQGGDIITDSTATDIQIDWGSGNTQETVTLIQTAPNGCSSFPGMLGVGVYPEPVAAFSMNPNVVLGSIPIQFTDQSQNPYTWNWNFGNGSASSDQNPTYIFNEDGTYSVTLIITTEDGCMDTVTQEVTILDGINIPDVFTPNGDGSNDIFEISGSNFENFHAEIYNRWGTKIFESDAAQISWDGTTLTGSMVTQGTYFLTLVIKLLDGSEVKYGGTVNVFY